MKRNLLLFVVATVVALAIPLCADTIVNDDPHLQVGPCMSGFPNCSGDPNYFPSTLSTIDLYDQGSASGNGSGQPVGTIALILVTPSSSTDILPTSAMLSSGTATLGGANFLGGHWNTTTGLVSSTPMTSGNIITDYIGFQDTGDGSDNISNFNLAEQSIGYPTGSYYATIFSLANTGMSGPSNNPLMITFNSDLPEGTIILAYSCIGKDINNNVCTNGGTAFVPWTTAGFVDTPPPVPEPGTLLLLASGFVGLALLRRK
jgi:PEP-CTERM motif